MTLRLRLTLLFSLLCSIMLLASFLTIFYLSETYLKKEFEKRLTDKAVTTAVLLLRVEQVDSSLLKIIDRAKHDNLYQENISIIDETSKEIYTNNDTVQFNINTNLLQRIKKEEKIFYKEGEFDVIGLIYNYRGQRYVVLAGAIDVEGRERLRQLGFLLSTLLLVLISLVALTGWIYAGRALNPLKKVINQVENLSSTDLSLRLTEVSNRRQDEISKLIIHFNKLLARIENAFNMQKSFVSNVSHELKNPLTKITSQLEVAGLKPRSVEEYGMLIRSVLDDVKEINTMASSLLDLAMITEGNHKFTFSDVRIDELLWEVRERLMSREQDCEVDFSFHQMPDDERKLLVNGNAQLLQTALQNLMENGYKFSFDKKVGLSLFIDTEITIKIQNAGPGIPSEAAEKIFQPFYRATHTSDIKGYGIGLPLAEKIIALHGGKLEVESVPNVTTVVSVTLPMVNKVRNE